MQFKAFRLASAAACAVGAAAVISACGSSTTTTGTGSVTAKPAAATGASASGLTTAKAAVAAGMRTPPDISRPALSAKPPTGKTIVYVSCPLQTCAAVEPGLTAGAKALGWKLKVIQGGIDPQSQNTAWTQAVQDKPDGIVGITTVPFAALSSPLAAATQAKIPVVTMAGSGKPYGSIISNLVSPPAEEPVGRVMADWVATASGGKANVALYNDPSNPSFNAAAAAFKSELAKVCSGCTLHSEQYSTLNIGKSLPGQVVSFIQQNPSVDYVGFTLDDAALGLPQALTAAGLSGKVQIFGRAAGPPNTVDISKGLEAMGVGEELTSLGWEALDALARTFVGDRTSALGLPPIEHQVLTKDNVSTLGSPSDVWQVPNVPRTFLKLWHVSS